MESMLNDLKELIGINSISKRTDSKEYPFGKEARQALDKALSICDGYGFRVKNCNNILGYAEIGKGEELMGILVHLDVVPAGDGWNQDPFEMTVSDGKIYGRGVTDDKGPAIAAIHAMKELLEEDNSFNKRVRIIFGMAEETGEWDDLAYYKENEEAVDFGFTPDADFPAIYAEKGIANIKFTFNKEDTCFESIKGGNAINMVPDSCVAVYRSGEKKDETKTETLVVSGKSAHGSTPEDGENAISKLMAELSGIKNCELTRFFKECIKMEFNGKSLGGYFADKESGEVTYNYGMIDTTKESIHLLADIRYPISYNIKDILASIRKHLVECGHEDVRVELLSDVPYVFLDAEGPVIKTLLEAYREHTGDMRPPTVIGGGTYARAMEGIVAFGPMIPGRELTEHQANEYMYQDDLMLIKEIYKTAIRKLACYNE